MPRLALLACCSETVLPNMFCQHYVCNMFLMVSDHKRAKKGHGVKQAVLIVGGADSAAADFIIK